MSTDDWNEMDDVGEEGDWGEGGDEQWDEGDGEGDGDDGWGNVASPDDEQVLVHDPPTPVLTRQQSVVVLNNDALLLKQDALIKQTAEVLFVTPEEAGCLLRHYG